MSTARARRISLWSGCNTPFLRRSGGAEGFSATRVAGDKEPTIWVLTMPDGISSGDTASASPELLVKRIHEITCEIYRLREERTANPVRVARELLSAPYRVKRLKRHLQACATAR
jgi:hypothetical protein